MYTIKNKYTFAEGNDVYLISTTKDYVITNWDYKGISVLNKSLELVINLAIEDDLVIDSIYIQFGTNTIALYCPENKKFFIINIETSDVQKVTIPSRLNLDEGSLSSLYYWKENNFVIKTHQDDFLLIDSAKSEIGQKIGLAKIKDVITSNFEAYIKEIIKFSKYVDIKTMIPDQQQFTYYNVSEGKIGFVDYKNNLHYSIDYISDNSNDIHDTYFYNDKFVVLYCHSIESIDKNKREVLLESEKFCEFGRSSFDNSINTVFLLNHYWRDVKQQASIYSILLN